MCKCLQAFPFKPSSCRRCRQFFFLSHLIGLNWCVFKTIFPETKENNFLSLTKKLLLLLLRAIFLEDNFLAGIARLITLVLILFSKLRLTILYVFTECYYPKVMGQWAPAGWYSEYWNKNKCIFAHTPNCSKHTLLSQKYIKLLHM